MMQHPDSPNYENNPQILKWLDVINQWSEAEQPTGRLWLNKANSDQDGISLVAALRQKWVLTDSSDLDRRVILWADLTETKGDRPEPILASEEGWRQWLEASVRQTKEKGCDSMREYDPGIPFEAMLDTFVDDLCLRCHFSSPPILIVEGFDRLLEKQRFWVEERVLVRFLARTCTRVLLFYNERTPIQYSALRWLEEPQSIDFLDE